MEGNYIICTKLYASMCVCVCVLYGGEYIYIYKQVTRRDGGWIFVTRGERDFFSRSPFYSPAAVSRFKNEFPLRSD